MILVEDFGTSPSHGFEDKFSSTTLILQPTHIERNVFNVPIFLPKFEQTREAGK
jgi:hypothetical protein